MNSTVSPVAFAGGCLGRERHICAFFNSADEEYRSLLPFIKQGFDRGERAVHIVDEQLTDEHVSRLKSVGIDTESAAAEGQLEIRPWEDAYLRGERFDQDAMLALIEEVLQNGSNRGFPLTRQENPLFVRPDQFLLELRERKDSRRFERAN